MSITHYWADPVIRAVAYQSCRQLISKHLSEGIFLICYLSFELYSFYCVHNSTTSTVGGLQFMVDMNANQTKNGGRRLPLLKINAMRNWSIKTFLNTCKIQEDNVDMSILWGESMKKSSDKRYPWNLLRSAVGIAHHTWHNWWQTGDIWPSYTQKSTKSTLALKLSVSPPFYPWVTATELIDS